MLIWEEPLIWAEPVVWAGPHEDCACCWRRQQIWPEVNRICINPLMNQMFHQANVSISINLIKSSRNPVLSFPVVCWLLVGIQRRVCGELGSPTIRWSASAQPIKHNCKLISAAVVWQLRLVPESPCWFKFSTNCWSLINGWLGRAVQQLLIGCKD